MNYHFPKHFCACYLELISEKYYANLLFNFIIISDLEIKCFDYNLVHATCSFASRYLTE